jgi:CHAT domain-containing protein
MRSFTVMILSVVLLFQHVQSASGQTYEPPKLEPVFSDDFTEDSRGSYEIEGDVMWAPRRLTLAEGTSITREVDSGAWARVELKIAEGDPTENIVPPELRIWLLLDGATSFIVRLRRHAVNADGLTGSIALLDMAEADVDPIVKVVREQPLRGGEIGNLTIQYRHGLVEVTSESGLLLIAHIENGAASVAGCRIESSSGTQSLTGLSATAVEQPSVITTGEERQLNEAFAADEKLVALYDEGKFAEALSVAEEIFEIQKQVLGELHPDCAASLNNLAVLCEVTGNLTRAELLHRHVLELRRAVLGERHPEYATSLNNLGVLHFSMGNCAAAEPLCKQACEIEKSVLGDQHPSYAASLNNLAVIYRNLGDYASAEPLYRQSMKIDVATQGRQSPAYATSLNNMAALYESMGDYIRAEKLYRQALAIRRSAMGEQHPDYAISLNNLAGCYAENGEFSLAETLYRDAIEIETSNLGEQHPNLATSLNNLALLHQQNGDYIRAKPLHQQALTIRKAVLGEQHASVAQSFNNLAVLHDHIGNHARAEELYRRALAIRRSALGEQHPDYANSLNNLAGFLSSMREYSTAESLFQEALAVQEAILKRSSLVQSMRQQHCNQVKTRSFLDDRLANSVRFTTNVAPLAQDTWRWKGAVTTRQRSYRRVADDPTLSPLFADLRSISQKLSAVSGRAPVPPAPSAPESNHGAYKQERDAWEAHFASLVRESESVERQIASDSADFRRLREPLMVASVQSRLPAGTALVDFLQYTDSMASPRASGPTASEDRFIVFVVRNDLPPTMIRLTSASSLAEAIRTFRRSFQEEGTVVNHDQAATEAAQRIRRELWLPIEEHLAGIDTVIISPDAALGTLPFGALPGRKKNGYLLEDYRIALLPMANLLTAFSDDETADSVRPGLLLVGDVDYDAEVDAAPTSFVAPLLLAEASGLRGAQKEWTGLAGFRAEFEFVHQKYLEVFGESAPVHTLTRRDATEDSVLDQAPEYGTLHLITHGYFEDPKIKSISQVDVNTDDAMGGSAGSDPFFNTYVPGLLSGLVMAGANTRSDDPQDFNDGILRASEIEASSLQGVDLVVLSACETGLGAVAGGEGLTGLQRAFHIAGAQTVIASLWKVDDRSTQELMRRFYTNLWEQKMSKIDALREAQLWMLRHPKELEAMGVKGAGTRGRIRDLKAGDPKPRETADGARTDPYFWAAFQLSGDWR